LTEEFKGLWLLDNEIFPREKESNILNLHKQIKSGNLGISLSSFEEIYNITPKKLPFPVGCVNFEDGKRRFVISWIDDFTSYKFDKVEEYSLRIRNYPVDGYPVISLLLGLHNGKVNPDNNQELWLSGSSNLDISYMLTRIKLFQLINSHEVLFCLFDNSSENLDSYGFSLNEKELDLIDSEIKSSLNLIKNRELTTHLSDFNRADKCIKSSFHHNGLPKTRDALNIYLERKEVKPKPEKHNWNDFTSI